MERRLFLQGLGGTVFGLPLLESLVLNPQANAATGPLPYAIFLYQPMGPEVDSWWPKKFGQLTKDSLIGQGTEPLANFAEKLIFMRGLGHSNHAIDGGDHGEGIATTLTAALVDFESKGEGNAKPLAPSIDHVIAKAFGGSSLNLAIPDNGGPGLSWAAAKVPNSPENDPLKAYNKLFPNGEMQTNSAAAVDPRAALKKGVNDRVRAQMKALLANPKLSKNDRDRLELHMSNIRDLETSILSSFVMPEPQRKAIQGFKGNASDRAARLVTPNMLADILAIAAATGQRRAMTLQLGSAFIDSEYDETGAYKGNNWHGGVSHGNDKPKLKKFDLHNQQIFARLLKSLSDYKFEDNGKSLLDFGTSLFVMSMHAGHTHWRYDMPHILAGGANGRLKTGQYIDLNTTQDRGKNFIPTNRLYSTIGKALGADGTENFNAGEIPKNKSYKIDQKGVIDEILV